MENKHNLPDRIINGTVTLLTSENIRTKLNISKSTFNRWVTNHDGSVNPNTTKFPLPDINIGNSARWTEETFRAWLENNLAK